MQQFKQLSNEVPNIRDLLQSIRSQAEEIQDSSSAQEMNVLYERIRKANSQLNRFVYAFNFKGYFDHSCSILGPRKLVSQYCQNSSQFSSVLRNNYLEMKTIELEEKYFQLTMNLSNNFSGSGRHFIDFYHKLNK